jgi:hypothetical protein
MLHRQINEVADRGTFFLVGHRRFLGGCEVLPRKPRWPTFSTRAAGVFLPSARKLASVRNTPAIYRRDVALPEQQLLELQNRLKEAEERGQRAMSMAQLTKSGHVYIISNVGSFGEHVYKIGLTRRLDPLDRVRELGDSSVPFSFDVHALIKSEDAPALEHRLHRHFLIHQVNKVNHRKEFFRVDLETIRSEVESLGLESQWTMAAEATQYRESLAIERRITEDPVAREQWLMRQLELEMVEENEPADDEAVLVAGADDDE